ncbi:nucleoside diphosphate kinase 7 isoform X1 [Fundulus heteroclitus]|uniref:nucleoside diphosphate kinase 7 isoform X1 n=1 Tax=Fundulus heteroclitus TaxID=8078 RepID=UPI00165A7DFD|nr:nucleoside diphosphate kinase 7 isoform X1 [Fundulus heteroclitus]
MEDRYAFLTEWYDPTAALLRRYQLFYYPQDGSVEMFDVKNRRMFLRRTKYDDIHQEDLFVGNRVNVFSRQLNLIDYGDQYTANKLGSKKERTLALVKPDAVTRIGDIFELIYSSHLIVTKAKMTKLTWSQAADFYAEHQSKPFFNLPPFYSNLVQFVSSGPAVAMELMGDEATSVWRKLLGPADSAVARKEAPQSVRAQFGTDAVKNVCHGSESLAAAARELEFFFPSTIGHGPSNTAVYTDCTCCIIKPHAISEGLTGKILNSISAAGFEISALEMFNVDRANAEEFYEVYKGVVTEYPSMVTELCSGPCLVLEIHGTDVPKSFREFCGPSDPEIARHLRSNTLRALYGKDKVRNAVHCTDLPEDGGLEVQYFFKILDG